MIARTLRDMLCVYYHCKSVEVDTSDYATGYFFRRTHNMRPAVVLNAANREGAIFKSYENKKWHGHLYRKVTYINTNAECVRIPLCMLFDLIESVYFELSIPYVARGRSRGYINHDFGVPLMNEILSDLAWEALQTWDLPKVYHIISFKDTHYENNEIKNVIEKLSKSFHQEVFVSNKLHASLGASFVVIPKNTGEFMTLCLNRLKVSLGKTSDQIIWNMVVEDGVDGDMIKPILDTLLECTPNAVLDHRLL